jgi:hypothetical protein
MTVTIFSKIPRDIRKSRCTTGINATGGKFVTGINDISGELARDQQHWRQTMGTISNCRYLKVNLEAKIYIYVSKGVPTKLLQFF